MATDEFRFAYTPYVSLADRHFNKLGSPLPQGVSWDDILKAVPAEQYKPSDSKAVVQLGTALATLSFGIWLISLLPWVLLPIGWAVCGVAATSLYAVWRDASNNVWSSSSAANELVATLTSLFLLPNAIPISGLKSTSKTDAERRQRARAIELFGSSMLAAYLGIGWDLKAVLRYLLVPIIVSRAALRLISKLHRISPVSRLPAANSNKLTTVFAVPSSLRPLDVITNFVRLPVDCFTRRTAPTAVMPTYNAPAALSALLTQFPAHFHECIVGWRLLADLFTFNRSPDAIAMENSATLPKKSQSAKPQSKPAVSAAPASPSPIAALINFAKRLNLIHCYILLGTPALALYGAYSDYSHGSGVEWSVRRRTLVWSVIYYFCTGLGITAGYHRLWSHKAYSVHWTVELLLSFFSSGAVEGSAIWWCRGHRAHHRYTDTDNDPYSAKKGFFYAHMGWMLMKPDRKYGCDVTDLKNNWILSLQHRTYAFQSLFFGYAFPAMVAGMLWGDWFGGLWIAGALRLCFVHHSTFCVNSVAHYLGDQTFDDERTPRDSIVTALVTLGEGYHNFHHEFPSDYRNGIRFYDYDPTKWLISALSVLGLAWDLNTFPDNEIRKGKLNMTEKKLDEERSNIAWPKDVSSLPIWTEAQWKAAQEEAAAGSEEPRRLLVVVDGLVHELGAFAHAHPGGEAMLRAYANKDASAEFHGSVYRHSHAARNLLSNYRIARLQTAQ